MCVCLIGESLKRLMLADSFIWILFVVFYSFLRWLNFLSYFHFFFFFFLLLSGSASDEEGGESSRQPVTLVFFVGGCTYGEIAALRFLSEHVEGERKGVCVCVCVCVCDVCVCVCVCVVCVMCVCDVGLLRRWVYVWRNCCLAHFVRARRR